MTNITVYCLFFELTTQQNSDLIKDLYLLTRVCMYSCLSGYYIALQPQKGGCNVKVQLFAKPKLSHIIGFNIYTRCYSTTANTEVITYNKYPVSGVTCCLTLSEVHLCTSVDHFCITQEYQAWQDDTRQWCCYWRCLYWYVYMWLLIMCTTQ